MKGLILIFLLFMSGCMHEPMEQIVSGKVTKISSSQLTFLCTLYRYTVLTGASSETTVTGNNSLSVKVGDVVTIRNSRGYAFGTPACNAGQLEQIQAQQGGAE